MPHFDARGVSSGLRCRARHDRIPLAHHTNTRRAQIQSLTHLAGSGATPSVASDPPQTPSEPNPGANSRALTILFLTVFIDLVGFGIVIPLLPLYAEGFGASPVTVTWLLAVYSLMQFAFAPWWGRLSDRFGRRPILLIGLFGSGLSYIFFGLATTLFWLFFARIAAGIMGANIGVAQAYVADVTRPEDRARGMGMIGAAFGLGFIFGPIIGGVLSGYGPAVPFLGAGILTLLNGVFAIAWLPETRDNRTKERIAPQPKLSGRLTALVDLLRSHTFAGLYVAFFLVTFAFAELEATLSLWADRRWALTPAQVAYMFAYLGIVVTIVQGLLVGPMTRAWGERRLAIFGGVAFAAGLIALPLVYTPLGVAAALGAIAVGQGATVPSVTSLISRTAPEARQGELLGISQSLSALGRVVGPIFGGIAFSRIGIGAPFLTGAALVGLGIGAFALLFSGESGVEA